MSEQDKKSEDELAVVEKPEELDAIIDADFSSPLIPKDGYRFNKEHSGYRFYASVKDELMNWWEEWDSRTEQGGQKFRTLYQFAKYKGKSLMEQAYIMEMCGPEPVFDEGRSYLRVPWLGDWAARRQNSYWAPDDPEKVQVVAKAIKRKQQQQDAVRSSAAYLVQELAWYTRASEQVDAAYGGQLFLQQESGDSPANVARFKKYFGMRKAITKGKVELLLNYWLAFAFDPKNPTVLTQINTQVNNGQMIPDLPALNNKEMEVLKLAKHLQAHAANFEMPLPQLTDGKLEPKPAVEVIKPNGKEKVQ